MCRRGWLLGVALTVAFSPGAAAARTPRHASATHARPRAFSSCGRLVGYARRHFAVTHGVAEAPVLPQAEPAPGRVPPTSGSVAPQPSAGPSVGADGSTTFSTTNNQEEGVEEPDIVKTDGATIFTVVLNKLYSVAVGGGAPRLAGSLDLGSSGYGSQLLLRDNRLIVISGHGSVGVGLGVALPTPRAPAPPAPSAPPAPPAPPALGPAAPTASGSAIKVLPPGIVPSPYFYGGQTMLTEVDVHDPAAMRITRQMTIDGTFVDARQNGSTARVVVSSAPRAIADARLRARASGWVPTRRFHSAISGRRYARPVAACTAVRRPVQFSGLGMLTILTLNLDRGLWAADSTALMADAQVVYGSTQSLYVATQRWVSPQTAPVRLPASQSTVIDRFDATNADRTNYVSSGEVPGYLLNQFSMSEYKGYLRVATTSRPIWWGAGQSPSTSQSYVTVLASQGGVLAPVGQVSGLGAGQQIYSVRFLNDAGYVVTFRQVDPLYTLDLATPAAPRVAGQLELQGYSSYLHPVGDGLLVGIGVDVAPAINEPSGTQLELFDVSSPAAPKLLQRTTLGQGSSSEVQTDHHAFLFWPLTKLAVLPLEIYPVAPGGPPSPLPASPGGGPANGGAFAGGQPASTDQGFIGAVGFRVDRSGIVEAGRVVHDAVAGSTPLIRRSIVIGQRLFTVSDGGVMSSTLDTLVRQTFVAFPAPVPTRPLPTPGPAPAPGRPAP